MATGHWDPGYGDIISRFHRTRAAKTARMSPGACNLRTLKNISTDPVTLDEIRERAREAWLHPDLAQETSYQDHFRERLSHIDDRTNNRPTSSCRKNKPHPSDVFLVTHLHEVPGDRRHNVPGFHNADATLGKPAYLSDDSVSPTEQARRAKLRSKFTTRPHSAALKQYQTQEELEVIQDPMERQATEAWLKLASDNDKENVLGSLRELQNGELASCRGPAMERSYRPCTVASLHRYLRHAGAHETSNLTQMYDKHVYGGSYDPVSQRSPVDIVTQRMQDLYNTRRCVPSAPAGATKRGDYLMHPEWPPRMKHHRLNGLSTIDQPYSLGRR